MKYLGLTALVVLISTPVTADHFIYRKQIADVYKCDKENRIVKPTAEARWDRMPEGSICAHGAEEVAYANTTGGPNTATGYQSIMAGGTDV